MKKFLCVLLAALLLTAGAGLAEAPVPGDEAEYLYTAEPSDGSGGYCVLTMRDELRITPDETFSGTVTWTSDDPSVATVEDGRVLPVGPGIALIVFTDGTATGLFHVLVNTMTEEPKAAGALHIELDGETYQSSISLKDWDSLEEYPHRLKGTADNLVWSDGSRYYVRTVYLFNIACCALGKSFAIAGVPGELPQLYGKCDMGEVNVTDQVDLLGEHTALLTCPRYYVLPDGTLPGRNLYTVIVEDGKAVDAVRYGFLSMDGQSYEDVATYLDLFGIRYELEYDAEQEILTVKLTKEGDA